MNRNTFHSLLLVLIAITLLGLSACKSDPPTGTDSRLPAIYGRVLEASGNPVANAGINLLFNYTPHTADTSAQLIILSPNPVEDAAAIGFWVEEDGHVTMRLLRADTRAVVKTLANQYLMAGQYTSITNVRDIPNQAYIVRMESPGDTAEAVLVVQDLEIDDTVPLLRTDSIGAFTIQYSSLPVGRLFHRTFDNGTISGVMQISSQLEIAIDGPGTSNRIWSLLVDTTAVVDSTLRLP